jgi:hypothetical protein
VQVRVEAAMLEGNPWKPEVDIGHGLVAWDVNSPCASSTDQVCNFTDTLGPCMSPHHAVVDAAPLRTRAVEAVCVGVGGGVGVGHTKRRWDSATVERYQVEPCTLTAGYVLRVCALDAGGYMAHATHVHEGPPGHSGADWAHRSDQSPAQRRVQHGAHQALVRGAACCFRVCFVCF